jgi:pimeloyl-ACP methyl ester carboxylesterase
VSIQGNAIHYETAGSHGPAVILVMGLRARGLGWLPIIKRLQDDHRLLWFDHQGVGESGPVTGRLNMSDMSAHIAGLMDHLGWDSAHIVGVSMGGMVSQRFALDHRERVRSLSLLVTAACGRQVLRLPLKSAAIWLRTNFGSPESRLSALGSLLYSSQYLERVGIAAERERLTLAFGQDQPGTVRAQIGAMVRHDVRSQLGDLSALPVLVVGAGQDQLVRIGLVEELAKGMPGAQVHYFDEAGHGVLSECADEVAELLRHQVADADRAWEPTARQAGSLEGTT